MSQSFRVEGMSCQGCVRSVTKAIQAAVPGTEVVVDLEGGIVTVDGATVAAERVTSAITDAGFDVVGPA